MLDPSAKTIPPTQSTIIDRSQVRGTRWLVKGGQRILQQAFTETGTTGSRLIWEDVPEVASEEA